MRKWLYLITDHPDEEMVGLINIGETHSFTTAKKNEEGARQKRNLETNESYVQREVGLGCADFDDEEDYEDRIGDVVKKKLGEIDEEHLKKAGLDPETVVA